MNKTSNLLWGIVLIIIGLIFGLNALEITNINNTIIEDSMCKLINLSNLELKNIKLLNSNFGESTIMDCNMKNIEINNINFIRSEITNTPLKNIDLSIHFIQICINFICF